jgi:4-diphosphocytidyl-2-C-methyl-D-erythritol kinase
VKGVFTAPLTGYNRPIMPTTVRSFSKINLGLAIGPVRADGFHGLTTLYQTLAAHDSVSVKVQAAAATRISVLSNHARVPTDERNTAFQAARLALEALGAAAHVEIHIEKRLPVQAGMGAGSANAAAALIGLERELGALGIAPLSGPEKLRIAAEVGSDVPLFLMGGAVLGVGRGEEVYPMPDLPAMRCVVALPEIGVSTPQAFRDWDALHSAGSLERRAEREMRAPYASWNIDPGNVEPKGAAKSPASLTHPDPFSTLKELSRSLASAFCAPHSSGVFAVGQDPAEKTPANFLAGASNPLLALVRTGIENDFEEVVFPQNPLFGEIKRTLAASESPELAAVYAALSGSGSALFAFYATEAAADAAEERLAKLSVRSMRTETLTRDQYWRGMLVE